MNKHLIEQLIVGRKHKKVRERQSALICWSNWRWLDTRSLSQLEKLGGFSCIQKVLCGNKSRHFPNCGLEHSSRTRESHLSPECLNCQKPSHWARVCHSNQEGVRGRSKNRGSSRSGIWSTSWHSITRYNCQDGRQANLVYCRKSNGKLKICLTWRTLTRLSEGNNHVISTLEEIPARLAGAKYLSIVDAKCGCWIKSPAI